VNELNTPAAWQRGTPTEIGMGSLVTFRQSGQDVKGVVLGIRQTGKYRGKWEVRNETTGRTVCRTRRQLRLRHA
jgi:hypothetical protein